MPHFELFTGNDDKFYWRLRADNGQEISRSSQGYADKRDCKRSIEIMMEADADTEVKDMTSG